MLGILHTRDLLNIDLKELDGNRQKLTSLLREAYFVPESKTALGLFDSFRESKRSFALTVDEYGGITGLVTMEDLLECIFGDIPSPSDINEQYRFEQHENSRLSVDGGMPLDDFNRRMKTHLDGGEMETLGGFVLHTFGELPTEGQSVSIEGFKFTATEVSSNRIAQLSVEPLSVPKQKKEPEPKAETVKSPETDTKGAS